MPPTVATGQNSYAEDGTHSRRRGGGGRPYYMEPRPAPALPRRFQAVENPHGTRGWEASPAPVVSGQGSSPSVAVGASGSGAGSPRESNSSCSAEGGRSPTNVAMHGRGQRGDRCSSSTDPGAVPAPVARRRTPAARPQRASGSHARIRGNRADRGREGDRALVGPRRSRAGAVAGAARQVSNVRRQRRAMSSAPQVGPRRETSFGRRPR